MKFHIDGTLPTHGEIFVFGSNLAGAHGEGAARVAQEKFGASRGAGCGWHGNSFAIPTKDRGIQTLPLNEIRQYIDYFLGWAEGEPNRQFFVTRIGCGLAGYTDQDIAPMFKGAPDNCSFANEWRPHL